MVEYKCHKCHKSYNKKSNYERHINRTKPCESGLSSQEIFVKSSESSSLNSSKLLNESIISNKSNIEEIKKFSCKFCGNEYTRKDNLKRHIANDCDAKEKSDSDDKLTLQRLLEEMNKRTANLEKENKEFKKKIITLESQIANNSQITNTQNTNNIGKQQNIDKQQIVDKQINNIKLVAFGSEDLGLIEDSIIKKILAKGFSSVPKLIEQVHFDKDHPEYHNVFISNIRTKKALTYDGGDWILRESNDVFDTLKANSCNFIDEKFRELSDKGELNDPTIKKMKRFIDQRDEDEEQVKLNNDIEMLLYNKRKMTMNTKKKLEDQEKKLITH
jgi:hypothetical protein